MDKIDKVQEYINSLLSSPIMGDQVAYHRIMDGSEASYAEPRNKFSPSVNSVLGFRG